MNLTNEFQDIREWAKARGILDKGNSKTQIVKLMEETGELAKALLKNNQDEIRDSIGDVVVVLTSLAYHNNVSIEACVNSAYRTIKNRIGKVVDGDFQKDILPEQNL